MRRDPLLQLATWLLSGPHGEFILGDLAERRERIRMARGRLAAAAWFAWMAARSAYTLRQTSRINRRGTPHRLAAALEGILADLRLGGRLASKHRGVSVTTAVVLGLGIGVSTFAFGVHYGTYGRGLPVSSPDRMVDITATLPARGLQTEGVSFDDYQDLRLLQTTMDELALWDGYEPANISSVDAPPERITVTYATSALHRLLEMRPHHGRTFTVEDDDERSGPVAVLSHAFWLRRFGGDAGVVGRSVTINGDAVLVVGVLPADVRGFGEDVFLPLHGGPSTPERRAARDYYLLGRLRGDVTMTEAAEEFAMLARRLEIAYPETNKGVSARVVPFLEGWFSGAGAAGDRLLTSVGALMLLIAMANVANLFLIRRVARSRELQLRLALGASRWRVGRLVMLEAVGPAIAGALFGALLAVFALDWYGARELAIWESYEFEAVHAAFVSIVALAAVMLVGIITGLQAPQSGHDSRLTRGSRGNTGRRFRRVATALVVTEIALGGAALFVAGLMVKTAINLQTVDYGFAVDNVMTGTIQLDEARYPTPEGRQAFWGALLAKSRTLPGVQLATLATQLPMIRYRGRTRFQIEGETPSSVADYPGAYRSAVTPEFFDTFEKSLLQGRPFTDADGPHTEPVVIVNDDFVRKFLPSGDALGQLIKLGGPGSEQPWMRVIGIAPHMWMDTDVDAHPEGMYVPLAQHDTHFASVAVRVSGSPEDYREALRAAVMNLDPGLPLDDAMSMSARIHQRTTMYRRTGPQFILFGTVALVLSIVGLYGVMAYAARSRTREIGIRMALGAQRTNVLRLMLRQGVLQIVVGIALGIVVALYVSRGLSRFIFQMTPWDPWVLTASFAILGATGVAATWLPARRAARVDPLVALRLEE